MLDMRQTKQHISDHISTYKPHIKAKWLKCFKMYVNTSQTQQHKSECFSYKKWSFQQNVCDIPSNSGVDMSLSALSQYTYKKALKLNFNSQAAYIYISHTQQTRIHIYNNKTLADITSISFFPPNHTHTHTHNKQARIHSHTISCTNHLLFSVLYIKVQLCVK